jgi:HD-GYP domain-containing protein (c-di-GMP phosphodiesterase class II)
VTRNVFRLHSHERWPPRSHNDEAAAALLYLLDRHSPGVTRHMERTGELARLVAFRLGVGAHMLRVIVRTAVLHDVGKLGIPASVLHKPGPLTDTEWIVMRQHPVLGEALLERTPGLLSIAPLVRSSHERWDGNGYPDGLAGDRIPLPARIVAACDAFDAITEERRYGPQLPVSEAVEELRRGLGSQFDPEIVEALCDVVAGGIDVAREGV